jgi:hypothetical protein
VVDGDDGHVFAVLLHPDGHLASRYPFVEP